MVSIPPWLMFAIPGEVSLLRSRLPSAQPSLVQVHLAPFMYCPISFVLWSYNERS
jgi:hypothetical protein